MKTSIYIDGYNLYYGRLRNTKFKGLVDQLILVSNDSDAEPVLAAITEDFPHLKLGLIMP